MDKISAMAGGQEAANPLAASLAAALGEEEVQRASLAQALRRELLQALTALKMDAAWLRKHPRESDEAARTLDQMLLLLEDALASTRRVAGELRPLVLDDLGLVAALESLASTFMQRHGADCALEVDEDLDVPEPCATGLFRIVQEWLLELSSRAEPARVHIGLVPLDGGWVLQLAADTGGGRVPAALRARVHVLRGSLTVKHDGDGATRVQVRVPAPHSRPAAM